MTDPVPMSTSVPPPGFEPPPSYGSPAPAQPGPETSVSTPPSYVSRTAHRSGRPQLLAGGALAVAVVGVLAFVLFGSGGGALTDPVAQAATVSSGAAGYKENMTMAASVDGIPFSAAGSGVVDLSDHAVSMTMGIDLSQIPQAAQVLGGSSTMQMGMILVGGEFYMKFPPALASRIPSFGSKPWLKIDLSKLTGVPGMSSLMSNPAMSDPTQVLRYLLAEADSVKNEGEQTVDGLQTTHYRIDLALDRVPHYVPTADRAQLQQALSRLEQTTQLHELPADVWVDAHHLIRRVVIGLDLHMPTGPVMRSTITENLTDYGPQATPTPPPADQVQDMTSLAEANGANTAGG
jgi:hypothetical protein